MKLQAWCVGALAVSSMSAAHAISPASPEHGGVGDSAEPFFTQLDNQTWIIGNDVWNLTQKRTYGVKLMYRDQDLVGTAAGHYASYSLCPNM